MTRGDFSEYAERDQNLREIGFESYELSAVRRQLASIVKTIQRDLPHAHITNGRLGSVRGVIHESVAKSG